MKASPITALRRLFYGATLVGMSGLSLFTKTHAQTTECTEDIVEYEDVIIQSCSRVGVEYKLNNSILYKINGAGWGLDKVYDGNNEIPVLNSNKSDFNILTIQPGFKSVKFFFAHSDGRTCYIQRDFEVVSPATLTITDKQTEGCEGVLTKAYPTADGDFDHLTWTVPAPITETKPPFTLSGIGNITIQASASKDGCDGEAKASLTYTVRSKPIFTVLTDAYIFPQNNACKSCEITLSNDVIAVSNSLSSGRLSNAQYMTGPLEISNAKIVWGNNPNPASKLTATTTFKGTYTAKVQSSNNCGSSGIKDVSFEVNQTFIVEDCAPSILPSSMPCNGQTYDIIVRMPKGELGDIWADYNFQSTPTQVVEHAFKSNKKELYITAKGTSGNGVSGPFTYSFKVPTYKISCPSTTKPLQTPTAPAPVPPLTYNNGKVELKAAHGCGFTSSYEYCTDGGQAVYTVIASADGVEITGVDLGSKAGLFTEFIASKQERQYISKEVITSANKNNYDPLSATISYSSGGQSGQPFSEEKNLNPRTDCSPALSVTYRSRVDGKAHACAGDTILLTMSKNSSAYELVGMDIPFGNHTTGDTNAYRTEVLSNGYASQTYRFISYHCYVKGGTEAVDSAMPFKLRYKDASGNEKSTIVYEKIKVKTCPPVNTFSGVVTKDFGQPADVTFTADNTTTNIAHWKVDWNFYYNSFSTMTSRITGEGEDQQDPNMLAVSYNIYPFRNDTSKNVIIWFNEGDSLRSFHAYHTFDKETTESKKYDWIFKVKEFASVRPSKMTACAGEQLDFFVNVAAVKPIYCDNLTLTWTTPADVKHTKTFSYKFKSGKNTYDADSAFYYHTNDARPGSYMDYHWILSFRIIGIDKTLTFDLYPPVDFLVRGLSDAFRADTLRVCQGLSIEFDSLVKDPNIVSHYILNSNPNYQYYNSDVKRAEAADKGPVKAYVDFGCEELAEQTAYLVVDADLQTGEDITVVGALCIGSTVELFLNSNGLVTWTQKEDGKADSVLCRNCPTNQHPTVLLDNIDGITIVATQTNGCVDPITGMGGVPPVEKELLPLRYPDITMSTEFGECPYTPFDFKATVNNTTGVTITGNYTFFNLRTGQSISTTALSDANGLNQYILQPQDSLLLCYNSSNSGCNRRDSARLVAYPSPVLEVTANGEEQVDNGTYCLTKGTKRLTLRASGANDYTWLTEPVQTLGRSLVLEDLNQDSTLQVKGVENRHNCVDTFALKCVIAVGQKSPSAAICPGDAVGACFEADSLSGTTYAWSGPDNFSQNGTNESKGFIACGVTQNGTYTLTASRNGCASPLNYTLSYHPTPELSVISNSPLCRGEMLSINFKSNLSTSTFATSLLTHSGTEIPAIQYRLANDRIIYEKNNVQLSDTGYYKLFISTTQSCSTQASLYVEVDTAMPIRIRFDGPKTDSFCEGSSSKLIADIAQLEGQSYLYSWFIKNPDLPLGNNENTLPVVWRRDMDNRYVYVRVKQRTCTSTDSVKATVIPLPVLGNMPADTGICHGFPFYLNPTADATPEVVIWYFMDDNGGVDIMQRGADLPYQIESVDPVNSGRYFFNVINRGCLASSDTTRLTVNPLPKVSINGPIFICSGSQITLTANADLEGTYQWQHSGENTAAVVITKAGEYSVIYTTVHGCIGQASASIEGRETPYFQLPGDTSICRGTSFVLVGPEGLDSVMWHDGLTDNNRVVEDGGWYILTGYKNECPFTDSLFVKMTFCGQFHIPSAFSPNGNQVNDTWGAISAAKDEDMSEYDLMVFDRDGRVVFHGKKISDQWDGRYKGKMCPPGVYPYTFRATEKFEGIRYQASGTVTIVL